MATFKVSATATSASPAPVVEISAALVWRPPASNSLAPVISARSSSTFPSSETCDAPLASRANLDPVSCFDVAIASNANPSAASGQSDADGQKYNRDLLHVKYSFSS